ncbi:unnamed protein product [Schistosoma curassoni]|uniref:DDE_Tnp_1_7 domain-containing protein n=1 Tax=Schistosoma curassoni TaxID=6186 RepID=A0A183L7F1_9TREM|nr:unnamed protein product [Schistosoma curassoni]
MPCGGLNPFIPETGCNIGKLSSSQQDDILLNAHKVVTTPDDQGTDPVNEILSPESNALLLALSNSEKKLHLQQNDGSGDTSQESCESAYLENNWDSTINLVVLKATQNHWETEAFNEPNSYLISHVHFLDMTSHNNAHNFGEISCKNGYISAEPNYDQKFYPILLDVDFPSDLYQLIRFVMSLKKFSRRIKS